MDEGHFAILWIEVIFPGVMDRGHFAARLMDESHFAACYGRRSFCYTFSRAQPRQTRERRPLRLTRRLPADR